MSDAFYDREPSMDPGAYADREVGMSIQELVDHVEYKLHTLPQLCEQRGLNATVELALRESLQSELQQLLTIDPSTSLQEFIESGHEDNHYLQANARSKQIREA